MCALAYYLERQGILTTGISLVRENVESMQPPRSLWVSFPLGRPLGKPSDPAFQHGVIKAALDLLNAPSGPILEDYPIDAPNIALDDAPACPVTFVKPAGGDESWVSRLSQDLAAVQPWYDLSRRRRGRTLVGVAEGRPEDNLRRIGQLLDQNELPLDSLKWFKHAVEDLKVLYLEALTAQPGNYDQATLEKLFWQESIFGAALIEFYHRFRASGNERIALVTRMIVPREAVGENTGTDLSSNQKGVEE